MDTRTKICTKCGLEKSNSEFYKNSQQKNKLNPSCKSCVNEYHRSPYVKTLNREWRKNHKRAAIKGNLKHNFNMTLEQYDQMFEEQNGICAICGGVNFSGRRLGVDHNHETGKIRGLLCHRCNFLLGALEDKEFTKRAKQYLKGYSN